MNKLYKILAWIFAFCVVGMFFYGCYHIGKTLSYEWWYESMVEDTIREMVKPECLK